MIKTAKEFNEKYREYLEENCDGLILDYPSIVQYLDTLFDNLIKIPEFKFRQIYTRNGIVYFENSLAETLPFVGRIMDKAIEERLNFMLSMEREILDRIKKGELYGKII